PAVIARSRAPKGSRALEDTDGKTTRTRSRKIATRPNTETTTSGACRWGGRPVRRLSRYANGISQPTTSTNHATVSHGWVKKRVRKKRVSTGTLPYQITRYWDQKKYIHMIEIANWSFATSCTAAGGIEACPRAFARTVRSERRQNPIYRVLTTKYPPNRPLYHAGSSDITRSKPHSETPMTQRKRRTTARRFRRARHGEPRPEHQVHQVDRPHRSGIARARAREEGDGAGRRDEAPEDRHFRARARR